MSIECVVDSSSIISLCKCGLQDFLGLTGWRVVTVPEVFGEVVVQGSLKGELDVLAARALFDSGAISRIDSGGKSGRVDDVVLGFAESRKALFLVNDVKLNRRGKACGLEVLNSAALCLFLYQSGKISKTRFKDALDALVGKQRLSKKTAQEYLKEV